MIDKEFKYKEDIRYFNNLSYYKNNILPSRVEINITNECTRACSFCPNPSIKDRSDMTRETFYKIIQELVTIGYNGTITFCGFGEPLYNKYLGEFVIYVVEKLPNCYIELMTNGDLLDENILSILQQQQIDMLRISCYDEKDLDGFKKIKKYYDINIIILERYDNFDFVYNRNGFFESDEVNYTTCYYPFYSLFIDVNGDVLSCPQDFTKTNIIGNIFNNNIIDIWNNSYMKDKMVCHKRKDVCPHCNIEGTVVGKIFYDKYKEINND